MVFGRKPKPVVVPEVPAEESENPYAEQFGIDRMPKVPRGFVRNQQGLLYCSHGCTGDACFSSPGIPRELQ
jgi:hypothetical protein